MRAFKFPEWFGHNFNAWRDSFNSSLMDYLSGRVAIIRKDADVSFTADAGNFVACVCEMNRTAEYLAYHATPDPPMGLANGLT